MEALNFRTVDDLNRTIVSHLPRIPRDIDIIAGIPRSGLLVANLLALYLEKPLTDLDGLLEQRLLSSGRTRSAGINFDWATYSKVLIVDDSVDTGMTLELARRQLTHLNKDAIYCCVYVTPTARKLVDIYMEVCTQPRFFQWNIMHHGNLSDACMDIDGVLCRDPLEHENDDATSYRTFLATADPLFLPRRHINYLVTNRLEKYREDTVSWLAKYEIKYSNLIMSDYMTRQERQAANNHASFKAQAYLNSGTSLFIESSLSQARVIASKSGKHVLCVENWSLITPDYRLRNLRFHLRNLYLKHGYKFPPIVQLHKLSIRIRSIINMRILPNQKEKT